MVRESEACEPLRTAYQQAEKLKPKSWKTVEELFLGALAGFDTKVAAGETTQGERQNGKGDFFNDLLALVLENCAGVQLYSRGRVPGFIFPQHNLDVTYPNSGVVKFTLEAKATGSPKGPHNPAQKNPLGRDGANDLEKRVKEGSFKVIDLKAEYGRIMAAAGKSPAQMSANLTNYLRKQEPTAYLFIASRCTSEADRDRVESFGRKAAQVFDGVGVYCFTPTSTDAPTAKYKRLEVSSDLELERRLHDACSELTRLKAEGPTPYP